MWRLDGADFALGLPRPTALDDDRVALVADLDHCVGPLPPLALLAKDAAPANPARLGRAAAMCRRTSLTARIRAIAPTRRQPAFESPSPRAARRGR